MPGNSRTATRAKAKRGLVPRDADLRRSSRFGVCTSSPPLDLPVELVEWIARYLEFKDVLSARIACKGLHACTNTAFGRVALSERSFLLVDPSSMQTLYDISVHPVYSHWVKCIRFSIASLQTPSSDHMQRIHVLGWAKTRQDRLACRDYARQHAALYRKHAEFKPECRALLSKILSKFLKAGNAPGIVATGTETEGHRNPKTRLEGSRPFGIGKLTRAVRYERWCVDRKLHDWSVHAIIMRAAIIANYPLQRLEMGFLDAGVPPRLFKLTTESGFGLSSLKTLKLTFSPEVGYIGGGNLQLDHWTYGQRCKDMAYFLFFIAAAQNLETLSLTIGHSSVPSGLHDFTFKCLASRDLEMPSMVTRLRELELVDHQVDIGDLFHFITVRRETLRSIRLNRVRHYDMDFPWMAELLTEFMLPGNMESRHVEVLDSYNGGAWVSDYTRRSGFYRPIAT